MAGKIAVMIKYFKNRYSKLANLIYFDQISPTVFKTENGKSYRCNINSRVGAYLWGTVWKKIICFVNHVF